MRTSLSRLLSESLFLFPDATSPAVEKVHSTGALEAGTYGEQVTSQWSNVGIGLLIRNLELYRIKILINFDSCAQVCTYLALLVEVS